MRNDQRLLGTEEERHLCGTRCVSIGFLIFIPSALKTRLTARHSERTKSYTMSQTWTSTNNFPFLGI